MCSAFDWKELDCFPFSSPHAGQSSAQSSKVRIKLAIITPTIRDIECMYLQLGICFQDWFAAAGMEMLFSAVHPHSKGSAWRFSPQAAG